MLLFFHLSNTDICLSVIERRVYTYRVLQIWLVARDLGKVHRDQEKRRGTFHPGNEPTLFQGQGQHSDNWSRHNFDCMKLTSLLDTKFYRVHIIPTSVHCTYISKNCWKTNQIIISSESPLRFVKNITFYIFGLCFLDKSHSFTLYQAYCE